MSVRNSDSKTKRMRAAAPGMYTLLLKCKDALLAYTVEAGPCDHDVGICICSDFDILDKITALEKLVEGAK